MKKVFTILGLTAIATMNAQIVINEVYGGGGNSGATLTNDFVELINRGTVSATISGASLQYASAAGAFNQYHPLPNITLAPGQTYLIQEGAGAGGTVALAPDFVAPIPTNFISGTNTAPGFAMSGTNLKIVLASDLVQVTGPTDANVLDFVGVGSANLFEGAGAAPVMTNTTSDSRTNGIDTNNNAADFINGTPTPKNSTQLAVSDVSGVKINLVKNSNFTNTLVFGAKANVQIISANGQVVKSASVTDNARLDVSSLPKGMYIISAEVNGQKVSQKVMKN